MDYSTELKEQQLQNVAAALALNSSMNVTFVVGPEEMEFRSNRMLLTAISDVFKAMLFGPMQESSNDAVIKIDDVSASGFQSVLHYAHCADPQITVTNVVAVKSVCRKYQITTLSSLCDQYFDSCIGIQTVCKLLNEAITQRLDEYVQVCLCKLRTTIADRSPEEQALGIVQSAGFMELRVDSMSILLQSDYLNIKEEKLWDAVLKWAARQRSDVRDIDQEPPAKRRRKDRDELRILQSVVQYFRFGLMESTYFAQKVQPTGCLSKDEVIAVFQYIAVRDVDPQAECGRFSTKKRFCCMDTRLREFVACSDHHGITYDKLGVRGYGHDCSAYMIYPKMFNPNGASKGVHFWSIKAEELGCSCYENIGVLSQSVLLNSLNLTAAVDDEWPCDAANGAYYEGDATWYEGDVITAVLDCKRGMVTFFENDEKVHEAPIDQGIP